MLETLNDTGTALYCWVVAAVNACEAKIKSFFSDERGLSGVVVAVLLVLVAVLAVVAFWGSLKGWLGTVWGTIKGSSMPSGIDEY